MDDITNFFPQGLSARVKLADGKEYQLSELHLNAQSAVKERFGICLFEVDAKGHTPGAARLIDGIRSDPDMLRFMVWQLLLQSNRNLTEQDVGYLVTLSNQLQAVNAVIHAIALSMPIPDSGKKDRAGELAAI